MPEPSIAVAVALLGAALLASAAILLRLAGANTRLGRRLRWAPEVGVGALLDAPGTPAGPMRVSGRIRCADPLRVGDERLVAFHRDIEVEMARRGWRVIERIRETRSFELWDHDGSLTLDPATAAEPLVSIPQVWRGDPSELGEPQRSAIDRIAAREGNPLHARAVTRSINVTDRVLVLALVRRDPDGRIRLEPPPGGYVISTLAVDDAMRLLGGRHRRLLKLAAAAAAAGATLLVAGLVMSVLSVLVGR